MSTPLLSNFRMTSTLTSPFLRSIAYIKHVLPFWKRSLWRHIFCHHHAPTSSLAVTSMSVSRIRRRIPGWWRGSLKLNALKNKGPCNMDDINRIVLSLIKTNVIVILDINTDIDISTCFDQYVDHFVIFQADCVLQYVMRMTTSELWTHSTK